MDELDNHTLGKIAYLATMDTGTPSRVDGAAIRDKIAAHGHHIVPIPDPKQVEIDACLREIGRVLVIQRAHWNGPRISTVWGMLEKLVALCDPISLKAHRIEPHKGPSPAEIEAEVERLMALQWGYSIMPWGAGGWLAIVDEFRDLGMGSYIDTGCPRKALDGLKAMMREHFTRELTAGRKIAEPN